MKEAVRGLKPHPLPSFLLALPGAVLRLRAIRDHMAQDGHRLSHVAVGNALRRGREWHTDCSRPSAIGFFRGTEFRWNRNGGINNRG